MTTRMRKEERGEQSRLRVIVAGAGLAGLGAAIAIRLAGHDVTVLEAAADIGEIGAGIQIFPNAARILFSWGMEESLRLHATPLGKCNFRGWKGNFVSEMDFQGYTRVCGAPFWSFHRADLHKELATKALELGVEVMTNSRVQSFTIADDEASSTVALADGRSMTADLVVGADGINSKLREVFLGREDPPVPTGDLAYRLLLNSKDIMSDPDLRLFVENAHINCWLGPGAHAVSYVLRRGELLNMVLLVPDDMPQESTNTMAGDAAEMRARFEGWDPRLSKLVALGDSESVLKWRLCIRPNLEPTWSHPSGAFTMLGDAVHATLPYLASGAGMALEDGGVLGLCLGRLTDKSPSSKQKALRVYEACRRERTERVARCSLHSQQTFHLPDGPEQAERDKKLRQFEELDRTWLDQRSPVLPRVQETGEDPFPWRYHGVGRWLLTYNMWEDVEEKWAADSRPSPADEPL